MTFFTQDENKNVVDAVSQIMEQRVAGENLPENVREAAVEAGKACLGKSLEERRQILHHFFNTAIVAEQGQDRAFRPTNETVSQFNEVARATVAEAQMAAGSFDDVAKSEGSPLEGEDKARINKRKVKEEAGQMAAGSFDAVAGSEGSPLESEDKKRLNLRKEAAESAGSFEDVAKSDGSPLESEDKKRLETRKEGLMKQAVENLANFGDKKKKFPNDKDGDGKVDEAKGKFPDFLKKNGKDEDEEGKVDEAMDTTGTEKEADAKDMRGPSVTTRATTVRQIDDVPVSDTHSFVKESWTVLVDCDDIGLGEQHILAGNLIGQDNISEACAGCPTTRQPFRVTVKGTSEAEAIENLASALENVGSKLTSESILVAHRTLSEAPKTPEEARRRAAKVDADDRQRILGRQQKKEREKKARK